MSNIAVICAHNPRNNGMYCVDWAARRYFSARKHSFDLCLTQGRTNIGSLRYRLIKKPEDLSCYDTVVYWGDFLNNPMWGTSDYLHRANRNRGVAPSDLREWVTLYLDIKQAYPSMRTIVAGGCALGASRPLEANGLDAVFRRFLGATDRIIVRDPGSFRALDAFGVDGCRLALGFDCATLLRPFSPSKTKGNYFVYSFHRSLKMDEAKALVARIEAATGLRGVPVRWLKNKWLRPFYQGKLLLQLQLMRHARFCVSDIYHFSICSMVQGTPAYCVEKPEPAIRTTVNEEKKRLLFEMVGLPRLLLEWGPDWERSAAEMFGAWRETCLSDETWAGGFVGAQQHFQGQLDELFGESQR